MELITGNSYRIIFKVNDKDLNFDATIIEDDGTFITFTDRHGRTITYNKNAIVSVMGAKNG